MRDRFLVILCLAILLSRFGICAEAQDVDDIKLRFESPDPNPRADLDLLVLERIISSKSPQAPKAAALVTMHARKSGKLKPAIEERLRSFALNADGSWNRNNPECCFEYARLLAKKDLIEALKIVNEFGEKGSDEQKVFAGECAGDIMLETGDEAAAEKYYAFAEKYGKTVEYAREGKAGQFALKRVQAALQKLRRKNDTSKYGEEFVLYREAENARKWGNHAQALALYDDLLKRFDKTIFARAAEVYSGYCLQKLNRTAEAEKRWVKVADGEPWGVYRGEALVALSELYLFDKLDFKSASDYFMQAQDWCDAIEKAPTDFNPFMPPERSAEVTRSPQDVVQKDQFGNISHAAPHDGALVNHLTAPWYLDDLRMRIASNYGFVLMVEGKVDEAKAQFQRFKTLDKVGAEKEKLGMGSFGNRMEWNLAHNKGCLRAYPEEAAVFTEPRRRLMMFMADLAFEKEDWQTAKEKYRRLLNAEFGRLTKGEEAYVASAIAQCESWQENYAQAYEIYRTFETKWRDTPSAPRALLMYANTLSGGKRVDEDCRTAVRIYDLVAKSFPNSCYAEDAIFQAALTCVFGHTDEWQREAEQRFAQYRRLYPQGRYKEQASEEKLAQRKAQRLEREQKARRAE